MCQRWTLIWTRWRIAFTNLFNYVTFNNYVKRQTSYWNYCVYHFKIFWNLLAKPRVKASYFINMIRKRRNLLEAKIKNALVKCFEEIKRLAPFFSFIVKSWVVKTRQRMITSQIQFDTFFTKQCCRLYF
jgi:hypothetical protein